MWGPFDVVFTSLLISDQISVLWNVLTNVTCPFGYVLAVYLTVWRPLRKFNCWKVPFIYRCIIPNEIKILNTFPLIIIFEENK